MWSVKSYSAPEFQRNNNGIAIISSACQGSRNLFAYAKYFFSLLLYFSTWVLPFSLHIRQLSPVGWTFLCMYVCSMRFRLPYGFSTVWAGERHWRPSSSSLLTTAPILATTLSSQNSKDALLQLWSVINHLFKIYNNRQTKTAYYVRTRLLLSIPISCLPSLIMLLFIQLLAITHPRISTRASRMSFLPCLCCWRVLWQSPIAKTTARIQGSRGSYCLCLSLSPPPDSHKTTKTNHP